jgi:hypothetical protein
MTARSIEDTARRLQELRREEWSDLSLAVLAIGLALAATEVRQALAMPLFLGGLAVGFLAARTFFRRWELFDRLLLDRDAYAIPEVRARAEQVAAMKSRRTLAVSIRNLLKASRLSPSARVAAAAEELEALASELEDDELALDPACAVLCQRLLTDGIESPLLNTGLPGEDVRTRVRQIRSGFERGSLAA